MRENSTYPISVKHDVPRSRWEDRSQSVNSVPRASILHTTVSLDSHSEYFVEGFSVRVKNRKRSRAVYHKQSSGNNKSSALARSVSAVERQITAISNKLKRGDSQRNSRKAKRIARQA